MTDIERAMVEIAQKVRAKADELEIRAAGMRASIADADFVRQRAEAYLASQAERYWWELREEFPGEVRPTIWAATAVDFSTGEGSTRHFLSTLARSEAEFRRAFARRTNRELANAAVLDEAMAEFMDRTCSREPRPAAFSHYVCHHENYA